MSSLPANLDKVGSRSVFRGVFLQKSVEYSKLDQNFKRKIWLERCRNSLIFRRKINETVIDNLSLFLEELIKFQQSHKKCGNNGLYDELLSLRNSSEKRN